MTIYIISAVILLILLYFIVTYNVFVKLKNSVEEAFATMDVYLKKRWDLIPNLVEVVKGYAKHESSVLENITKLRSSIYDNMSLSEKLNTNEQLAMDIPKLMAVVENYPELKANQNFSELSSSLSKIEDEIANSRKYYNAVVKKINTKIEMFPSNIIAIIFGFEHSRMFEAEETSKNNVKVEV